VYRNDILSASDDEYPGQFAQLM